MLWLGLGLVLGVMREGQGKRQGQGHGQVQGLGVMG